MERLLLFDQSPSPLQLTPRILTELMTTPASVTSGSGQVLRYKDQLGRVGMVAYLIDCYDRAVFEERYVKVCTD